MELKSIPLVVLLIGMIFLGSTTFIGNLGTKYSQTADYSGLNATQTRMIDMQADLNSIYNTTQTEIINPDEGQSLFMPYSMLKLAWRSITTIFGTFGVFGAIFGDITNVLSSNGIPVPSWLVGGVISVIVLFIIIMGIYALFKWKVET